MRILIIISMLFSVAFAQRVTIDTTIRDGSDVDWNVRMTFDPNRTDSNTMILGIGGAGQNGTDPARLQDIGPHYWQNNGWDLSCELPNGTHYPVFITLQNRFSNINNPIYPLPIIKYLLARFKVRKRGAHIWAISRGGKLAAHYIGYKADGSDFDQYFDFTSFVNVMGEPPSDAGYGSSLGHPERYGNWTNVTGGKILVLQQYNDGTGGSDGGNYRYVNAMTDSAGPGRSFFIWTYYGNLGHSEFNTILDPSKRNWTASNTDLRANRDTRPSIFIDSGINVYEWMLLQGDTTLTTGASPEPCEANAGADQSIQRGNVATLDGSSSVGDFFQWRRINSVPFSYQGKVKKWDQSIADLMNLPYRNGGYDIELTVWNSDSTCVSKDTTNVFVEWGTLPPQSTDGVRGFHYATSTDVENIPGCQLGDIVFMGARAESISGPQNGYTAIYSYETSPHKLQPGAHVWIKGGDYHSIVLNFGVDSVVGSRENPIIITNYDGQVRAQYMSVYNLQHVKITGKYDPGVSGDVNFQGHANGEYEFSSGKYGIHLDNKWSSLSSAGLRISGTQINDVEVEYIEVGNGNFAGVMVKKDGSEVAYNNFRAHDMLIKNTHGEACYWGEVNPPRHMMDSVKMWNVRVINAGNEGFQFNNIGAGSDIYNNVFVNTACNWKSPFDIYQDNAIQLAFNNGGSYFRNNIILGTGTQMFNGFTSKRDGITYNGDSVYIKNNLMLYGRGAIGSYWTKGAVAMGDGTGIVLFRDNFFGKFFFDGDSVYNDARGTNTQTIMRTVDETGLYVFRNNRLDGTKTTLVTGDNFDTSGTVTAEIIPPIFRNSGFLQSQDWTAIQTWADTLYGTWGDENYRNPSGVKGYTPVIYSEGDRCIFLGRYYISKVNNNHAHMPKGVTDDYWELQTWTDGTNTYDYPPEDYRLQDGDIYKALGMGIENFSTPAPVPDRKKIPRRISGATRFIKVEN